jgi:hypothetical protein
MKLLRRKLRNEGREAHMFNFKDVRPQLEDMGFHNLSNVYWTASTPHLYEQTGQIPIESSSETISMA